MIKYEQITHFAEIHPDKIALCDGAETLSWKNFKNQTKSLCQEINNLFINDDKPILCISRNSINFVLLGSALSTLGIPFQGVDYHLDVQTIATLINQLDCQVVFISAEFMQEFSGLMCSVVNLDQFVEQAKKARGLIFNPLKIADDKKFKSYAFTSGTTDIPKIVCRSKSADKRRFDYLIQQYHFDNNDIHLVCLPMYHVSATGWLRMFLSLGCTAVIHNYTTGYDLCEVLNIFEVTATIMSPIMLKEMIVKIDVQTANQYLNNLRFVITGGKNCSVALKKEAINKLGPIVYEYYGTTETGINTLIDSDEAIKYPGSVGRPFSGNELLIVDNNKNQVMPGEIGRIAIHSYMNMDSYKNNNAEMEYIDHDNKRYLLTQDYGLINSQGYLFVQRRGGSNVINTHPFYALENILLNLNYLEDVAISDTDSGRKVEILIVLNRYYSYKKIKEDIQSLANQFGVSNTIIKIVPKLEYTLTGKIKIVNKFKNAM